MKDLRFRHAAGLFICYFGGLRASLRICGTTDFQEL